MNIYCFFFPPPEFSLIKNPITQYMVSVLFVSTIIKDLSLCYNLKLTQCMFSSDAEKEIGVVVVGFIATSIIEARI